MKSHTPARKLARGQVLSMFMNPIGVALGGTMLLALALIVTVVLGH
jgi:hypothetical protein